MELIRNIILFVGWPILVIGSIYIFVKGWKVYKMVKGSLIGNVTKTLVVSMLVEMYSLGVVATFYVLDYIQGVYVVLPVFIAWFIMFIWALFSLEKAREQAAGIAGIEDKKE